MDHVQEHPLRPGFELPAGLGEGQQLRSLRHMGAVDSRGQHLREPGKLCAVRAKQREMGTVIAQDIKAVRYR